MSNVLLIDFGSTYTKITAVDIEKETIIGTAHGITTVASNIMDGLEAALADLFTRTGRLSFDKVLACSSAAGGLRMVAVGLVPELTAEAAKRAALGAGAKVLGVYCHELSEYEIAEIAALRPEIILLAGGTDGGNKEVILHNARMLAALGIDVPVVVAGNKSVTPQVVGILTQTMSLVKPTANVMPRLNELDILPARSTIRDVFLDRIVAAKGLDKANRFVDRVVMPTPAAVLKAAELLSSGAAGEKGAGDLMVIDIGGATTDVYSVAKGDPRQLGVCLRGLPEPFAKRTVEGDLGMRYSAGALARAASIEQVAADAGVSQSAVGDYVSKVETTVGYLPANDAEKVIEIALGMNCARLSVDRHAGQLETHFTPMGSVLVQTGKDLTEVTTVIGTGGVIINHEHPEKILAGAGFDQERPFILKPKHPRFSIDRSYILSAMGLLGEEHPAVAVRMMKQYIIQEEI